MFKSSFYELNDTPVSNTIFLIEKTPPLGVTGRIGLFKKGKRDEIEVVGCWKGQCVNNFVADCRFMCDKPRGGGNGGFCGDHMVFRGERRGDQSSPIEYRMRTRPNWVQISRDHRNITEPYERFHQIYCGSTKILGPTPSPGPLASSKSSGREGVRGQFSIDMLTWAPTVASNSLNPTSVWMNSKIEKIEIRRRKHERILSVRFTERNRSFI